MVGVEFSLQCPHCTAQLKIRMSQTVKAQAVVDKKGLSFEKVPTSIANLKLSEIQKKVLAGLLDGKSYRQIALQNELAEGTVKNIISGQIYIKVGCSSRQELFSMLLGISSSE